ncbi:MAG: ribbon-helix-helix domain-containing protein [Propionibacteriaceae bacterium]|nr:ribbon-helix-helix domain-containing protein [Propionibacteriaceae bacterium]
MGNIDGMKLSVSLPEEDVKFLDAYRRDASLKSRSAAVQAAIQRLRDALLADEYTQMFSDPAYLDDTKVWDATTPDGLPDETR